MRRDQVIKFLFYRSMPEAHNPNLLVFKDELLQCTLDEAVRYPKEGVTTTNCELKSDLTGVAKHHFKDRVSPDGTPYVDIIYYLVVNVKTAIMKLSLEIDGEEMGSVEANYG